jgi:hypothetical protein
MTLALHLTCLPASSPREGRGEEKRFTVRALLGSRDNIGVPLSRAGAGAPLSPFFTGRG